MAFGGAAVLVRWGNGVIAPLRDGRSAGRKVKDTRRPPFRVAGLPAHRSSASTMRRTGRTGRKRRVGWRAHAQRYPRARPRPRPLRPFHSATPLDPPLYEKRGVADGKRRSRRPGATSRGPRGRRSEAPRLRPPVRSPAAPEPPARTPATPPRQPPAPHRRFYRRKTHEKRIPCPRALGTGILMHVTGSSSGRTATR